MRSIDIFDTIIEEALKHISNVGFTDNQRALVSLSVRLGGLGIPIAKLAAFPAVIASIVHSEELQRIQVRADVDLVGEANGLLSEWIISSGCSEHVSIDKLRKIAKPQQWLNENGCLLQRDLLVAQGNASFKTLVYACSAHSSGSWTSALLSPYYETFMSPSAYRCAFIYRTCHPIFSSSTMCHACRQRISDAGGDHDSFCQGSGRLIRRHNLVRDKFFALAQEARLSSRLEVGHLIGDGGLKLADIVLSSWDGGRDLCLNVSIVSPFASLPSISETGEAARKAEERKVVKYDRHCMSNDLIFCPFV